MIHIILFIEKGIESYLKIKWFNWLYYNQVNLYEQTMG